jgi:hypothetical protein
MFLDLNARRSHLWPGYYTIRLFLFGWLKTQIERREHNGEDELYEAVNEKFVIYRFT